MRGSTKGHEGDFDALAFWRGLGGHKTYMRSYGEGVGTASREWLLTQIKDGESLLDVGCGPGCTYESLKVSGRQVTYRGLDFCPEFVAACRELFPEGDFRQGDAMALDEADNSWDTVLLRHVLEHAPGYRDPIAEAVRVARKRVVIVMWRPLSKGPDRMRVAGRTGGSNDFNASDFLCYLNTFVLPITRAEFGGRRPNWAWVLHKTLGECVFDLDDYHDHAPNAERLSQLQDLYPELKVTLFAIPGRSTRAHLEEIAALDWVELAGHGWEHDPNTECKDWGRERMARYLDELEDWGCFARGFRPPGWQISNAGLDELAERDYWVAPHWRDRGRVQARGMRVWYAGQDYRSVHGHLPDIRSNNPRIRNGIRQLMEERGLPWDEETRFLFVSEVVEKNV